MNPLRLKQLYSLIICVMWGISPLFAQNILQKKIELAPTSDHFSAIMHQLSQQAGFDFAYNAALFAADEKYQIEANNEPLSQVLDSFLSPMEMSYKVIGEQIIIYPDKKVKERKASRTISGLIMDQQSGEGLAGIEIHDEYWGMIAYTDANGRFERTFKQPTVNLNLWLRGGNYQEKHLKIRLTQDRSINIMMEKEAALERKSQTPANFLVTTSPKIAPLDELKMVQIFVSEDKTEALAASDTLIYSPFQVGLLPALSSNFLKNAQSINGASFNLLAGYAAGVQGIEMGGIANIDRFDMRGAQLAGVTNIIGGSVEGIQMAGIFNHSKGYISGAQMAGVTNIAHKEMAGIQMAGINNVHQGRITGLQMAGVSNVLTSGGKGLQVAGISNMTKGEYLGVQLSAVLNRSKDKMKGWQVAGLINVVADSLEGFQLAALSNINKKYLNGSQVSALNNTNRGNMMGFQFSLSNNSQQKLHGLQVGLINVADTIRGSQLGLINHARRFEGGVPFGLFSFVSTGANNLELLYEDENFLSLNYKTGHRHLYNILTYAISMNDFETMTMGYGLGSAPKIYRSLSLSADVTFNYVQQETKFFDHLNFLAKAGLQLNWSITPGFGIFAGGRYNIQWVDINGLEGRPSSLRTHPLWTNQQDNIISSGWMSFHAGIRIGRLGH
ncbi:hypothetical protein [Persicobacter diffluens]|uniref:Secretin/TonB short N-terminal domain-containing protein n=1 Tax=Persicobacter diffluens TaxID=981 RepID=A0AAN4W385_9BACT|nr:hypothetical protein PEDI_37220 [Persicobacter diffluens]